jgi:hypothetical protein
MLSTAVPGQVVDSGACVLQQLMLHSSRAKSRSCYVTSSPAPQHFLQNESAACRISCAKWAAVISAVYVHQAGFESWSCCTNYLYFDCTGGAAGKDVGDVKRFLNRLLGLPLKVGIVKQEQSSFGCYLSIKEYLQTA